MLPFEQNGFCSAAVPRQLTGGILPAIGTRANNAA